MLIVAADVNYNYKISAVYSSSQFQQHKTFPTVKYQRKLIIFGCGVDLPISALNAYC